MGGVELIQMDEASFEVVDMAPQQSPLAFCWSCATSNKTQSGYPYRPLGLALTALGFVLFPKRQR
jgi:hypothetical protein